MIVQAGQLHSTQPPFQAPLGVGIAGVGEGPGQQPAQSRLVPWSRKGWTDIFCVPRPPFYSPSHVEIQSLFHSYFSWPARNLFSVFVTTKLKLYAILIRMTDFTIYLLENVL